MLNKLQSLSELYQQLTDRMSDPALISNQAEYKRAAKKRSELEPLHNSFLQFKELLSRVAGAEDLFQNESDPELKSMAEEELRELKPAREKLEKELRFLLIPKDAQDACNTIVEIRAGTGGEEAALFGSELFRMYCRYADRRGWKWEVMSKNETGIGGLKEIILSVEGKDVYGRLKYESGVHRVQRVPATEASGRIHTSAATVAVLPEAEDVDVHVEEKDLRIDVYRSSGPGGQSVNTTDSAVRVTHVPTGIVICCQDEKSQQKNKSKALRILRVRLQDAASLQQENERSANRRSQIGSGDRSERIRTYNFPQQRLTDHRINLTIYRLSAVMEGELDEIIDALTEADNLKKLAAENIA